MRIARAAGPFAIALAIACHGHASAPDARSLAAGLETAARACAKVTGCSHPHDGPRDRDPSACVDAWLSRDPTDAEAFASCVVSAKGCSEVDQCARRRGDARGAAFCRANQGVRRGCDGTRLVTCSEDDPSEATSIDCGTFGASCGEARHPGGLVGRACLSATLCPSGAPGTRCDGANAILACRDGAAERAECPAGAPCREEHAVDGTVFALCESPQHRRCESVGRRWCEGTKLVQCQPLGPFGQAVVADCSVRGLGCDDHAPSGASCVVRPSACESGPATCKGDALSFCAAGRPVLVGCREVGFTACDPDAHGVEAGCISR